MAGNTTSTIQSNQTFTTGVVPVAVGVLNPANSPQTVWDCGVGMNYAEMTTSFPSAPGTVTILLEGTYDGSTWTTLATTTNTGGETVYSNGLTPFGNLRARCTVVTGGSSPTVNVFATASQNMLAQTSGGTIPSQTVAQGGGTLNEPGWHVAEGAFNPTTNFTAQAGPVTGTVADFQTARQSALFQVSVAGTPTGGTITFFGSIDNTTFVPLTTASVFAGTAGTITAGVLNAQNTTNCLINPAAAGNNMFAMRYFRADISAGLTGGSTPTASCKVVAF